MRRKNFMTPHGIYLLLVHCWPSIQAEVNQIASDLEPDDAKELKQTMAGLLWKLERLQGKPKKEDPNDSTGN